MSQESIGKKVELAWLMAFYGGLLTEKQRQVLALHCEEDMSLGEIAQEAGISRQGVHEMITRASQKLTDMEQALGMAQRFRHMQEGLEKCRAALANQQYGEAEMLLDQLIQLDQEENNGF